MRLLSLVKSPITHARKFSMLATDDVATVVVVVVVDVVVVVGVVLRQLG